ncbi:tetratricopeptide repeat protein [Streptococcus cameli]
MIEDIYVAFDLMEKGQLQEALYWLDNLSVSKESPEYFDYLSVYGYVYAEMKDFLHAYQAYEAYLEKAISEGDARHQHMAYHQLCMVARLNQEYTKARDYLAQEEAIIQAHFPTDAHVWSVHLYEVGYIAYLMGDKADAEKQMTASLGYALQTDDLIAQACSYRGLGEILSSPSHFETAKDLFQQAGDDIGSQEIDAFLQQLDVDRK